MIFWNFQNCKCWQVYIYKNFVTTYSLQKRWKNASLENSLHVYVKYCCYEKHRRRGRHRFVNLRIERSRLRTANEFQSQAKKIEARNFSEPGAYKLPSRWSNNKLRNCWSNGSRISKNASDARSGDEVERINVISDDRFLCDGCASRRNKPGQLHQSISILMTNRSWLLDVCRLALHTWKVLLLKSYYLCKLNGNA